MPALNWNCRSWRPAVAYVARSGDRPQRRETGHSGGRPATAVGDRPQRWETGSNGKILCGSGR